MGVNKKDAKKAPKKTSKMKLEEANKLADEINSKSEVMDKSRLEFGLTIGKMMARIKEILPPKGLGAWVKDHIKYYDLRTLQRYIAEYEYIKGKNLTIEEAIATYVGLTELRKDMKADQADAGDDQDPDPDSSSQDDSSNDDDESDNDLSYPVPDDPEDLKSHISLVFSKVESHPELIPFIEEQLKRIKDQLNESCGREEVLISN